MLLRRGSNMDGTATAAKIGIGPLHTPSTGGWLARLFERLENCAWDRQQRAHEAYLAQAVDIYDLEYRMRQLDADMVSRGCMLR
jgi:hypothetical protein